MKAIINAGTPLNPCLEVAERPMPELSPNDVLVKVYASSVNPKDWKLNLNMSRIHALRSTGSRPALFGDDMAGVVVEVGSAVTQFKPGDAVYGMDMRLRTAALAEYARIATKRIALKPKSLSFEEAAGVPLAALTALQGLRKGHAKKGSRVFITGASGGVGTFAVQIAKALGCHVTAVCGTRNIEMVRALGADEVVDRHAGDFRQTHGPYDLVFDITSFETPMGCKRLMGEHGYFISTAGQMNSYLGMLNPLQKRASLIYVESYTRDLDTLREMIDASQVRPVLAARYTLEESQQAYEFSQSGKANGKIVITIAQ